MGISSWWESSGSRRKDIDEIDGWSVTLTRIGQKDCRGYHQANHGNDNECNAQSFPVLLLTGTSDQLLEREHSFDLDVNFLRDDAREESAANLSPHKTNKIRWNSLDCSRLRRHHRDNAVGKRKTSSRAIRWWNSPASTTRLRTLSHGRKRSVFRTLLTSPASSASSSARLIRFPPLSSSPLMMMSSMMCWMTYKIINDRFVSTQWLFSNGSDREGWEV